MGFRSCTGIHREKISSMLGNLGVKNSDQVLQLPGAQDHQCCDET